MKKIYPHEDLYVEEQSSLVCNSPTMGCMFVSPWIFILKPDPHCDGICRQGPCEEIRSKGGTPGISALIKKKNPYVMSTNQQSGQQETLNLLDLELPSL